MLIANVRAKIKVDSYMHSGGNKGGALEEMMGHVVLPRVLHSFVGKGMNTTHTAPSKQGLWLECGNQENNEKVI